MNPNVNVKIVSPACRTVPVHGSGSRAGSHSRQPRQNHSIQTLGLEGVVDVGPRFCVLCFAMWFGANASIRPARSINHKSPDRRLGLASRNERLGKAKTVLIVGREIRAAKSVEREAIKEIKRRALQFAPSTPGQVRHTRTYTIKRLYRAGARPSL